MSESRWDAISAALSEFQQYLAPHVPTLKISHANIKSWTDEQFGEVNRSGIFRQSGVYLLFNQQEELVYIGLAMNSFNQRIWKHDWVSREFTDIIAIPQEFRFLAPALECFLISRLRPSKNTTYRRYNIPMPSRQMPSQT